MISVLPLLLSSLWLRCQLMFLETPRKILLELPGTQQPGAKIQAQNLGVLVSSYWHPGAAPRGEQRLCWWTDAGVQDQCWALGSFCCRYVKFYYRSPVRSYCGCRGSGALHSTFLLGCGIPRQATRCFGQGWAGGYSLVRGSARGRCFIP